MQFNVFVAGRSGQLARELVRSANPDQFGVSALGRADFDIQSERSIRSVVEKLRPRLIVNAAAYTAVDAAESDMSSAFALNAHAAQNLARVAADFGIPIIHVSTDYVFDGSLGRTYLETDEVGPASVYGQSKLEGETLVRAANPQHVILRTAWVYSPFGKNFVKTMLRLASDRDEISVVADQVGNPTAARDIAEGIWKIAAQFDARAGSFQPGTFHMAGDGDATWAEFAASIFEMSGSLGGPSARVKRIQSSDYPTPVKRPANSRLDCTKLEQAYAVRLPDWRGSLKVCVEELLESGAWRT